MAIEVNDSNFEEIVMNSELPVLVDFWAEWCGPCKMMLPIVEQLSADYEGKLVVAKVDVDSCPGTAAKFGIRNIPTILFFKKGEIVDKQVGALPKSSLEDKIKSII
ncbi:thioredoxin [Porphyromonadaceae bacterium OttesenSCG-928-L07]|nr:thioredoxin [Porphyromonadaceae bacterium OttesenSCG-928-L07]MDL2252312.1 thioredoxin [Odoribacter sp. OttesenSCG-928-J03]MDL2330572.1 thioredoxin [Odoribacter sp. OttesenSCG-928-A06]